MKRKLQFKTFTQKLRQKKQSQTQDIENNQLLQSNPGNISKLGDNSPQLSPIASKNSPQIRLKKATSQAKKMNHGTTIIVENDFTPSINKQLSQNSNNSAKTPQKQPEYAYLNELKEQMKKLQKNFSNTEEEKQAKLDMLFSQDDLNLRYDDMATLACLILMKNVKTDQEVTYLLKIVQQLSIFQNQPDLLCSISFQLIQKSFTLQYYPKNTVIFNRGDLGFNFYIILRGSVATLIPTNKQRFQNFSDIVKMMTFGQNDKFKNLANISKKNNMIEKFKGAFGGGRKKSNVAQSQPGSAQNLDENVMLKKSFTNQVKDKLQSKKNNLSQTNNNKQNKSIFNSEVNSSNALDSSIDNNSQLSDDDQQKKQQQEFQQKQRKNKSKKAISKFFQRVTPQSSKKVSQNNTKQNSQYENEELSSSQYIQNNFPDWENVKTYKVGEGFGDFALLSRQQCTRTATILTREDTFCMCITKQAFDKMIEEYKERVVNDQLCFFKKFAFFQHIPENYLLQIIKSNEIQKLQLVNNNRQPILYKENDFANKIYFIKSGQVELAKLIDTKQCTKLNTEKEGEKQEDQLEQQINLLQIQKLAKKQGIFNERNKFQKIKFKTLGPGQFFGEDEVLRNINLRTLQASVISYEAEIFTFEAGKFQNLLKENKKLTHVISQIKEQNENDYMELLQNIQSEFKINTESRQQAFQLQHSKFLLKKSIDKHKEIKKFNNIQQSQQYQVQPNSSSAQQQLLQPINLKIQNDEIQDKGSDNSGKNNNNINNYNKIDTSPMNNYMEKSVYNLQKEKSFNQVMGNITSNNQQKQQQLNMEVSNQNQAVKSNNVNTSGGSNSQNINYLNMNSSTSTQAMLNSSQKNQKEQKKKLGLIIDLDEKAKQRLNNDSIIELLNQTNSGRESPKNYYNQNHLTTVNANAEQNNKFMGFHFKQNIKKEKQMQTWQIMLNEADTSDLNHINGNLQEQFYNKDTLFNFSMQHATKSLDQYLDKQRKQLEKYQIQKKNIQIKEIFNDKIAGYDELKLKIQKDQKEQQGSNADILQMEFSKGIPLNHESIKSPYNKSKQLYKNRCSISMTQQQFFFPNETAVSSGGSIPLEVVQSQQVVKSQYNIQTDTIDLPTIGVISPKVDPQQQQSIQLQIKNLQNQLNEKKKQEEIIQQYSSRSNISQKQQQLQKQRQQQQQFFENFKNKHKIQDNLVKHKVIDRNLETKNSFQQIQLSKQKILQSTSSYFNRQQFYKTQQKNFQNLQKCFSEQQQEFQRDIGAKQNTDPGLNIYYQTAKYNKQQQQQEQFNTIQKQNKINKVLLGINNSEFNDDNNSRKFININKSNNQSSNLRYLRKLKHSLSDKRQEKKWINTSLNNSQKKLLQQDYSSNHENYNLQLQKKYKYLSDCLEPSLSVKNISNNICVNEYAGHLNNGQQGQQQDNRQMMGQTLYNSNNYEGSNKVNYIQNLLMSSQGMKGRHCKYYSQTNILAQQYSNQ